MPRHVGRSDRRSPPCAANGAEGSVRRQLGEKAAITEKSKKERNHETASSLAAAHAVRRSGPCRCVHGHAPALAKSIPALDPEMTVQFQPRHLLRQRSQPRGWCIRRAGKCGRRGLGLRADGCRRHGQPCRIHRRPARNPHCVRLRHRYHRQRLGGKDGKPHALRL